MECIVLIFNDVGSGHNILDVVAGDFDGETIKKWLKSFYRRFFTQQFKRNCMPDGVAVGSISLSPRGAWRMPSDAQSALWLEACASVTLDPTRD